MIKAHITTEDEMLLLGQEFSKKLRPNTVITLEGTLGAGKTVFVKGLSDGLGIKEPIVSPTFTLVQLYESGRIPLYHLDLYRLGCAEEFDLIDGRAILSSPSVICIEWPDLLKDYLTYMEIIKIHISINEDKTREIEIEGDEILC